MNYDHIKTPTDFKTEFPDVWERMFGRLNFTPHCVHGFAQWILFGVRAGDFVMAILSNDLVDAACRADDTNRDHLRDFAWWLVNDIPSGSWRKENLKEWAEAGGLVGQMKTGGEHGTG